MFKREEKLRQKIYGVISEELDVYTYVNVRGEMISEATGDIAEYIEKAIGLALKPILMSVDILKLRVAVLEEDLKAAKKQSK